MQTSCQRWLMSVASRSGRVAVRCAFAAVVLLTLAAPGTAAVTPTANAGFILTWDGINGPLTAASAASNPALASNGSTSFGSGQLVANGGIHDIDNVINSTYGNSSSWIHGGVFGTGEVSEYIGVRLPTLHNVTQFAFGRDNLTGSALTDRATGTYTVQFTSDAAVGSASTWTTVGTITTTGAATDAQRHLFTVSTSGGAPIAATGFRLITTGVVGAAIDEIELFGTNQGGATTRYLSTAGLNITPSAGFSTSWNGNEGLNFSASNPALAPNNLAMPINGATAFSDGQFGSPHFTVNVNDGRYGNANSWISDGDATSFVGVDLQSNYLYNITSVAWGRDNGNSAEGQLTDRSAGLYTLQFTLLDGANDLTSDTGNALTGWQTIGTYNYTGDNDAILGGAFSQYFRHEYPTAFTNGSPLLARGIRLIAPNGNAIDELEVFGTAVPEPTSVATWCVAALGVSGAAWRVRRPKAKR